ncbi:hypothetical protein BJ138DRAFT_278322 [Hygrophoropsis aurantiaca]|uniref:Uncharacterized protein n=1 Tax=Hygrophoropsis aurantiaca TaxID=72124 RepID=A0ACB7ZR23_9AGAM|nr:hypothetical protein BJ138DRAFT_278322 [Hygrophoropsis aurantiaca]
MERYTNFRQRRGDLGRTRELGRHFMIIQLCCSNTYPSEIFSLQLTILTSLDILDRMSGFPRSSHRQLTRNPFSAMDPHSNQGRNCTSKHTLFVRFHRVTIIARVSRNTSTSATFPPDLRSYSLLRDSELQRSGAVHMAIVTVDFNRRHNIVAEYLFPEAIPVSNRIGSIALETIVFLRLRGGFVVYCWV